MAMVSVVSGNLYRRTHSLSRLAWSWVGGRLAPCYIHQMNRVNSQWLCHDDSTINIVVIIIIIIIIVTTNYHHSDISMQCIHRYNVQHHYSNRFKS